MIEKTLIMIKPDAIKRNLEFKILGRIKEKGFSIIKMRQTSPSKELLEKHYSNVLEKCGEEMLEKIIVYMSSRPVIVAIVQGDNAIQELRRLCGEKIEPKKCALGTIRFDYSNDSIEEAESENRAIENVVHTADSKESAEKEISLWFPKTRKKAEKETLFEKIAETISYTVPGLIRDIVESSNEKRIMYHGIKRAEDVDRIKTLGISPLPPEGACSYWSTGIALFHPAIDSPFFNYSGDFINANLCELNLALTSYELLKTKNINVPPYESDSQLTIKEDVPFETITLLNIKVEHPESEKTDELRKYRRRAEHLLLRAIDSRLIGKFEPGKIISCYEKYQEAKWQK